MRMGQITQWCFAHFARLFKIAAGLAPHQYVIRCRIEEAKRLLAKTQDALSDIGLQVGCADQSHFTRHFRRIMNTTPANYASATR